MSAITSLTTADAGPDHIAAWLPGHWMIENRLHWIRDVDFNEDRSQIHTGSGPQVMATLRNTAIGLLRLAGHTNIATARRHHARDFNRPIALLLTCSNTTLTPPCREWWGFASGCTAARVSVRS